MGSSHGCYVVRVSGGFLLLFPWTWEGKEMLATIMATNNDAQKFCALFISLARMAQSVRGYRWRLVSGLLYSFSRCAGLGWGNDRREASSGRDGLQQCCRVASHVENCGRPHISNTWWFICTHRLQLWSFKWCLGRRMAKGGWEVWETVSYSIQQMMNKWSLGHSDLN